MNDNTFKSELLKQNGHAALDQEVSLLHGIIAGEEKRVRKLWFWTICVWVTWFLLLPLIILGPAMLASNHLDISPTLTIIAIFLFIPAILGLPVAGIILVIMLIISRRTASMNQVRASLAAIDTRLRTLSPGRSRPG